MTLAPGSKYTCVSAAGHTFQWLESGAIAIAALLAAIDSAKNHVRMETYIYRPDETGERVHIALVRAAERGVQVQLLIDAFGSSGMPRDYFQLLEAAGGQVRQFNPQRLLRRTFRNHRKTVIVDSMLAIVGGFNIGDEYAGDGVESGWRDLGMQVSGPIVAELERSFATLFRAASFESPVPFDLVRWRRTRHERERSPQLLMSGTGFHPRRLRHRLRWDLRRAHAVHIESAYFLPSWSMRRALKRSPVRLLLAGKTDVALARWASHYLYTSLLRRGVEIWEYQPQILHAKLLIIDDIVYVGSCNLDIRSLHINYELLLRIEAPELASQGRDIFETDLRHAVRVEPQEWQRARGFWQRLIEQWAYILMARLDPYVARNQRKSLY
jgi:cardiolipin synthase